MARLVSGFAKTGLWGLVSSAPLQVTRTSSLTCSTRNSIGSQKYFSTKVACRRSRALLLSPSSRNKLASRRLICSVATQPSQAPAEETKMEAPKEIFLKDYKMPDYYFDKVDLQFSLGEEKTFVSSKIAVYPRAEVGKRPGRKIMLEFKSECFSNYQLLQVGQYYVMPYRKELHENVNDRCHVSSAKVIINSQTPLWSVSFCCDGNIYFNELLQKELLKIATVGTDVVECESSFAGDLFIQSSPSQNSKSLVSDINLHLSVAARNLLKLDMEALEDEFVKPITISGKTDNSFMFTMGASGHPSGTVDPDCRLPQGSLLSVQGNIVCVHSADCHTVHFKSQQTCNGIGDISNTCLFQGLPSSICIHIAKDDHIVKLRGALS